jgi:hypothetical protein
MIPLTKEYNRVQTANWLELFKFLEPQISYLPSSATGRVAGQKRNCQHNNLESDNVLRDQCNRPVQGMNDGMMISKGKPEKPGPVPLGSSRVSHLVAGD